MEATVNGKILRFLTDGSGSGYGYGDGSGSGTGSGSGSGSGSGYGYGDGSGSGYGDGYGDGYGSGDGSGDGSGCGSGYGSGDGSGCGSGYGSGDGSGVKSFCKRAVFMIDGVATLINSVFGNTAKGETLNGDLTTTPCYIARRGNCFGHGETLAEAVQAAEDKLFDDMPVEDRTKAFWECHERSVKYPASDFFTWHHRLTGSCEMGRKAFATDHGIDLDNDTYTVEEFVEICGGSYGGDVIRRLVED